METSREWVTPWGELAEEWGGCDGAKWGSQPPSAIGVWWKWSLQSSSEPTIHLWDGGGRGDLQARVPYVS